MKVSTTAALQAASVRTDIGLPMRLLLVICIFAPMRRFSDPVDPHGRYATATCSTCND
ncbi:hypothetical protein BH11VER1_BH11VER1_12010 [soil metagenome]